MTLQYRVCSVHIQLTTHCSVLQQVLSKANCTIFSSLCLSYSIASRNTAAIKWLNHQFRAAFLSHAHRNSCSTALGAPFLWHLLGTNCLPGSCWHIQTDLLLQLLRAEAWKAQAYTKLQILQSAANPTSALYIHTCEDFTFYITFRISRQYYSCSGAAKERSSRHDCHRNTGVTMTSQQWPCEGEHPISTKILPAECQREELGAWLHVLVLSNMLEAHFVVHL